MAKDPSMPLYVNDWLSSARIQAMSVAEELAYFRLCLFCWSSGDASLPDDDEQLARLSRMGKAWFKGGSAVVRKCLSPHPDKDGYLTNDKVYELWQERQIWREKSRIGGRRSAAQRGKGGSRVVQPPYQPDGNSSSSSPSSSSIPSPTPNQVSIGGDDLPFAEGEGEDVFHPDGDEWHGIERSLRDLGLSDSARCIAAAKSRGCSPALVGMLIGHFQAYPKAWGVGLLHARIRSSLPGDDPTKGWPEPAVEHKLLIESKKPARALGPDLQQQRAAAVAELAAVEQTYGAAVDALPEAEVRALLNGNAMLSGKYRGGRAEGLVRDFLLRKVAKSGT